MPALHAHQPTRRPARAVRRVAAAGLVAVASSAALVAAAAPASAAPSCAGTAFSGYATDGPRTVSTTIVFVKTVLIPDADPGATFGQVISRKLAQADPC